MKLGNMLVMGLATLAMTPSSWALVGGPWDHLIKQIYSRRNTDGLYEASVSMSNGSGFLRFVSSTGRATLADPFTVTTGLAIQGNNVGATATNTTAGLAARSNAVIFHRGSAYYGSVFGTVNAFTNSVSGGGGGQSTVVDDVEAAVQQLAQNINAFVNISGFSESMNITFNGRVTSQIPEVRFQATGQAIFFTRPPIGVRHVPVDTGLDDDNVEELYEIFAGQIDPVTREVVRSTTPIVITPDFTVPIRLLGGRVNLQTSYGNTTQSAITGNVGVGN